MTLLARAGMRRAATLEAKHFKTSAGQLIAQMNAKFSGGEIGQAADLVNRFVTWATGDDDFHMDFKWQPRVSSAEPPCATVERVACGPRSLRASD